MNVIYCLKNNTKKIDSVITEIKNKIGKECDVKKTKKNIKLFFDDLNFLEHAQIKQIISKNKLF